MMMWDLDLELCFYCDLIFMIIDILEGFCFFNFLHNFSDMLLIWHRLNHWKRRVRLCRHKLWRAKKEGVEQKLI